MVSSVPIVTLVGSRWKLAPQAIVLPAFILPLGFVGAGLPFAIIREGPTLTLISGSALILTVLASLIWLELLTLRRMATPDVLILASSALRMTVAGRTRTIPWTRLGTPSVQRLSGRSAARSVVVPVVGGRDLVIAAEEYTIEAQALLKTLTQAQAGLPIDTPPRSSQATYLYIAIPASTLVLGIVVFGLAAILIN